MISSDMFFSLMLTTTRILFNAPPEPAYVRVRRADAPLLLRARRNGRPVRRSGADHASVAVSCAAQGCFIGGSAGNRWGRRDYKLYIPSSYHGQPLPLVVMLHGCTQNLDDFALGTGMNGLAEERQFFVLYPAQSEVANRSRCWNWFCAGDQIRDKGEPAILADITREIMHLYRIDPVQVYVAGLSAGGSMAAILARTYPDLFAAVGIHSGMPYASVRSAFFALHAMRYGSSNGGADAARRDGAEECASVPAIVFHGDMDETIHPQNGERIIGAQGFQLSADGERDDDGAPVSVSVFHEAASDDARAHTVTVCHDRHGRHAWEYWVIHGAGHTWSGGDPGGSYVDARGPQASRELIRFFFERTARRTLRAASRCDA